MGELLGQPVADNQVSEQVEIEAKYSGYIERQREDIKRQRRSENTPIPANFDYVQVKGLSNEVRQKLAEAKPETLARASRIPGVTPAALSLLLIYLKKASAAGSVGQASHAGKARVLEESVAKKSTAAQ